MKILILNDFHLGKSREFSTHPGLIRQNNTTAAKTLKSLIPHFNQLKPDLVVQLGDVLRDVYVKQVDRENITQALKLCQQIKAPQLHLLGNHELKAFSRDEMKQIYQDSGLSANFYGIKETKNYRFVWLDLELNEASQPFLPEERLKWLRELPSSNKPLIIFSHYSLVPLDANGSFYFEDNPQAIHLQNFQETQKVLQEISASLVVNAHTHFLSHKIVEQTHYLAAPAFSEKITNLEVNQHPAIFSVLELKENNFVFTAYSREFCFGKVEGELFVGV